MATPLPGNQMTSLQHDFEYQVGGSLRANSPSYVERQADQDLYARLRVGHFCYVFNARQMGKSSLRVRTMRRLKGNGVCCIALDMTRIGSEHLTPQQWYAQVISEFWRGAKLHPHLNLKSWLHDHGEVPYAHLLGRFIDEVLLDKIQQPIVIFIDEIDSTLSLPFSINDFFALIRACYNYRADDHRYRRLTFCLLGVATPADLITDKMRTPFNIGRAIALNGFTPDEVNGLIRGLKGSVANPKEALQQILHWTGGQPFLTQKLCQLAAELTDHSVEHIVQTHVITNWESQDEPAHLRTIRDRLLQDEQRANRLLGLYQQVLSQGNMAADESEAQMELRLSGLVVKQGRDLRVYNPIYAAVFNLAWVKATLNQLRPYAVAFNAWRASHGADESRLLRGQALEEALQWAAGRSLSNQDAEFLRASQQFENRETKQANEILAAANRQAKWRIRMGTVVLGASILGAIALNLWTSNAARRAQEIAHIERESRNALDQFEFDQTAALSTALQAAHQLRQFTGNQKTYPTTRPIIALQTILAQIQEQKIPYNTTVQFSHQGHHFITDGREGITVWDGPRNQRVALKEVPEFSDAVLSPDGSRILVSGNNSEDDERLVQLWDSQGKYLAALEGHPDIVNVAEFSPNSQYFVTGSMDGTAILWNADGKQISNLGEQNGPILSIQFSPDGHRIGIVRGEGPGSGWSAQIAQVWNLEGQQLEAFNWPSPSFYITLNPDLDQILTGGQVFTTDEDRPAHLWDFQGNQLAEFPGEGGVSHIEFSSDGGLIAAHTNTNSTVNVWDPQGNQLASFKVNQSSISDLEFSPDGRQIAIAGFSENSGTVSLWNLSGDRLKQFEIPNRFNIIRFSPDGHNVVFEEGTNEEEISLRSTYLLQLQDQQAVTFDEQSATVEMIRFSPDGNYVAMLGIDDITRIFDRQGKQISAFKGHEGRVDEIQFSNKDNRLVTSAHDPVDATVRIWDVDGNQLSVLEGNWMPEWDSPMSLDGNYTATFKRHESTGQVNIHIWHLDGRLVATLEDFDSAEILALRVSHNGQYFALGLTDHTAQLFDVNGKKLAVLEQHSGWVEDLTFNVDGDRILTFAQNDHARLWDLQGNLLEEFRDMHLGGFYSIAATHRDRLMTGGHQPTLWNFAGDQITALAPRPGWFGSGKKNTQLSAKGDRIATLGGDGRVRVWDDRGQQLAEYEGYAMALSPDGKQIVVVSREDNTPRLWSVDELDSLLEKGCDWLRPYLVISDDVLNGYGKELTTCDFADE
ncbi:MAG: AAA-like domain-containing protein [Leptolyngbya sp. SIO1E4]|nr:AAA-like domain-containing protein [Leptolyngbya sp. SIO1E4]